MLQSFLFVRLVDFSRSCSSADFQQLIVWLWPRCPNNERTGVFALRKLCSQVTFESSDTFLRSIIRVLFTSIAIARQGLDGTKCKLLRFWRCWVMLGISHPVLGFKTKALSPLIHTCWSIDFVSVPSLQHYGCGEDSQQVVQFCKSHCSWKCWNENIQKAEAAASGYLALIMFIQRLEVQRYLTRDGLGRNLTIVWFSCPFRGGLGRNLTIVWFSCPFHGLPNSENLQLLQHRPQLPAFASTRKTFTEPSTSSKAFTPQWHHCIVSVLGRQKIQLCGIIVIILWSYKCSHPGPSRADQTIILDPFLLGPKRNSMDFKATIRRRTATILGLRFQQKAHGTTSLVLGRRRQLCHLSSFEEIGLQKPRTEPSQLFCIPFSYIFILSKTQSQAAKRTRRELPQVFFGADLQDFCTKRPEAELNRATSDRPLWKAGSVAGISAWADQRLQASAVLLGLGLVKTGSQRAEAAPKHVERLQRASWPLVTPRWHNHEQHPPESPWSCCNLQSGNDLAAAQNVRQSGQNAGFIIEVQNPQPGLGESSWLLNIKELTWNWMNLKGA